MTVISYEDEVPEQALTSKQATPLFLGAGDTLIVLNTPLRVVRKQAGLEALSKESFLIVLAVANTGAEEFIVDFIKSGIWPGVKEKLYTNITALYGNQGLLSGPHGGEGVVLNAGEI